MSGGNSSGEALAQADPEVSSEDAADLISQAVSYLDPDGDDDASNAAGATGVAGASAFNSIPVELQVVIGSTTLAVSELLKLGQGATLPLDRLIGEPVDICVNGARIAKGELFVPEEDQDRIGVRITQIDNG